MLDIVEFAREKGIQEGKTLGIQEGIERGKTLGRQKALREGLLEGIELGLNVKFGLESLEVLPRIYELDDLLHVRMVKEAIKQSADLAEFTRILTTKILPKKPVAPGRDDAGIP